MTSDRAEGIILPSLLVGLGSSAKHVCNGSLCAKKSIVCRARVHRLGEECAVCYEYDLRLRCGLPSAGA